ncbi:unnamed protein product [Phytophthora fragariaefolia]|uniref:Unnamed protein product n=1 Tax=Phytophthora fragariaefolia TaxID=1490495 RepID=A0A9W6XV16_9STRA|nr:unnamed protein product [Phytophthora fragariaefolia]
MRNNRATEPGSRPLRTSISCKCAYVGLSGGSYHDVRTNSGVSVAASYASIHQVVNAVIAHPDLQLQFPRTLTAQRQATKSFMNLSSGCVMRGCVGDIDGWLCPIWVPRKNEVTRLFNKK